MEYYVNIHTHRVRAGELSPRMSGIHPWDAGSWSPTSPLKLEPDTQIVGETGLDFAVEGDFERQEQLFRAHLELAQASELPVVIHSVKAFERVMKILSEYRVPGVVFHGFIGSVEQLRRVLQREGYYVSFGERSMRSPRSVDALREVPLERMFLETDDSPAPIDGLYGDVAVVKNLEVEELQAAMLDNYKRLFRL